MTDGGARWALGEDTSTPLLLAYSASRDGGDSLLAGLMTGHEIHQWREGPAMDATGSTLSGRAWRRRGVEVLFFMRGDPASRLASLDLRLATLRLADPRLATLRLSLLRSQNPRSQTPQSRLLDLRLAVSDSSDLRLASPLCRLRRSQTRLLGPRLASSSPRLVRVPDSRSTLLQSQTRLLSPRLAIRTPQSDSPPPVPDSSGLRLASPVSDCAIPDSPLQDSPVPDSGSSGQDSSGPGLLGSRTRRSRLAGLRLSLLRVSDSSSSSLHYASSSLKLLRLRLLLSWISIDSPLSESHVGRDSSSVGF
ncbi:hypothetical protein Dimus_006424 [Dionaea muscipula]